MVINVTGANTLSLTTGSQSHTLQDLEEKIATNDPAAFERLLTNCNPLDVNLKRLLSLAIEKGREEIVKCLLAKGVDVVNDTRHILNAVECGNINYCRVIAESQGSSSC